MTKYTRLSMRDRCKLATLLDMKQSISEIARRLGRHRSSIYRELHRNRTTRDYRPSLADAKANKRRPRKALKLQLDKSLYNYVYARLTKGWSPEQIIGRMRKEKKPFSICVETIYQYVYQHGHKQLWKLLPTKRKRRRKRHKRYRKSCRFGANRLIAKRPKKIDKRSHMGDWEGDLIEFVGTKKKTVTTLVDRKSRMLILIKNTSKVSCNVMKKIKDKFQQIDKLSCNTITFDQGSEFANFSILEKGLECKIYYCEARSPWQKGSNENTNGRLRRYLPKKFNLNKVTQKSLDKLAEKMNNLPRKCLGYKTPKELLLEHINNKCRIRT